MRLRCVALAVLGLSVLPSVASAGPLTLVYHADVLDSTGAWLALPAYAPSSLAQQTDRSWRGTLSVVWPQDHFWGNDIPADPADGQFYSSERPFQERLSLTDPVSGQTGAVILSGWVRSDWEYYVNWDPIGPPWGTPWTGWRFSGSDWGLDAAPGRLTLSGVDYSFASGGDGSGDLGVTARASTPEPGTAVLAGMALGALGLRRLRRRATLPAHPV